MSKTIDVVLEDELQSSYIDYAMSVIIGRAIPEARDGLKPAQRRILYAMYKLNNTHNNPTKKSARIAGEVIGKFHPHGDIAVYETLVRMVQEFSMNHPLAEGQGNFGCFTKDTKIKLTDGRSIDFEQLIKEQDSGKRNWGFSYNKTTGSIEVAEIKNARMTRQNAELVEIILDNGEHIKCTPDHRFLMRNAEYRQAKDLKQGDSLMPLYIQAHDGSRDKKLKNYDMVMQPNLNEWQFIHHLADTWNLKEEVYAKSAGRIRHHIDINKKNNNPTNIIRLSWQEHWKIHYELASWRHKNDPEYVRKLDEGRRRYIQGHRTEIAARISERNRKNWKKPNYRSEHTNLIKKLWNDENYRAQIRTSSSINLKRQWQNPKFRKRMGESKSKEMKEKWQSKEYQLHMAEVTSRMSSRLWSDPSYREHISSIMKRNASAPEWRRRQSQRSAALWQDPTYRSKFSKIHFREMAKKSWTEENRQMHREKAKKQWENRSFREKIAQKTRERSLQRVKENPELMKQLAQLAGTSLHRKWQDPNYKEKVIKNKILGFVSHLLNEHQEVTPEIYQSSRTNNCIPNITHALKHFETFEQIVQEAKTYNHKVSEIIFLSEKQDTYDITIGPWHNFALASGVFVHNSIDGDPAAAQRYTEVRLTKLAEETLDGLEQETVEMVPNFDNTEKEPWILPGKVPNLLINGAQGIAVGVATSIPPHNLIEVCDAIIHRLKKKDTTPEEITGIIKGPDFPTGGIAVMSPLSAAGYVHGRGQLTIKGKAELDTKRNRITITEIPYNVNKSMLIQNIALLTREKKLTGIRDIRDESDRKGISIVVELKQGENPEQVLSQLYRHTQMEVTYPIINLAIVGKSLKSLNVLQLINVFIEHREEVILRRSKYELGVAQEKLHITEGLLKAIANIDEIIGLIRASSEAKEAKAKITSGFGLTEKQADAILEMRLSRLTRLEDQSLKKDKAELEAKIMHHTEIINDKQKIDDIITEDMQELKKKYGRPRRTEIVYSEGGAEITDEDLISNDMVTVILTASGYVKRMSTANYKEQARGGKGIISINLKEGDSVRQIINCNNKDYIVCISNTGRIYWLKAYNIPESSRYSEGRAIVNLLNIEGERIVGLLDVKKFADSKIVFLTKRGIIKRMRGELFSHPRSSGVRALTLAPNDEIASAVVYSNEKYLIIVTKNGKAIRFNEDSLRFTGRISMGVRGIRAVNDEPINILPSNDDGSILAITTNGFGKVTPIAEYRLQSRGGKGVRNIKINAKTGAVSRCMFVGREKQLVLINTKGKSITIPIASIRITGRSASGVRLMRMEEGSKISDAMLFDEEQPAPAEAPAEQPS